MSEAISIRLDDQTRILIEPDEPLPGPRRAGSGDKIVESSASSLAKVLEPAGKAARAAIEAFQKDDVEELQVEFGLKLNAGADVKIAKAAGEAHFTVRVVWKPNRSKTEA